MSGGTRRDVLAGVAFSSVAWATRPARAATGDLRLVVPAEPGGGWDRLARTMARVLPTTGGSGQVRLEYMPGAGGSLALPRFVRGRKGQADTLLVGGLTLVGSPMVNQGAVTVLDTVPVARLQGESLVFTVAANSPMRSADDLLRTLKADPAGAQVAGGSEGSADHVVLAMVGQALGIDPYGISYLPFAGGGPASRAVLDGRAKIGISNWSEFAPDIEAGRMRALAVSGAGRVPGTDVPTLRESGVDVSFGNWNGVFAPPGLSPEEMAALDATVQALVGSPGWAREAAEQRWETRFLPRAEFTSFVGEQTRLMASTLERLGLTLPRRSE